MEKIYNKLVRDNIPEIIKSNHGEPKTRILSDEEYKQELEKKLYEEYQEVLNTKTREERLEELADMLELIKTLAEIEGSTIDEVRSIAKKKALKRGAFSKKIYLESINE